MKKNESTDFEKSLADLEKIVADLEQGELPLEKQLKAFEKGVAVSRECVKRLEEIEHKVEKLVQNPNGSLESEPLESHQSTTH